MVTTVLTVEMTCNVLIGSGEKIWVYVCYYAILLPLLIIIAIELSFAPLYDFLHTVQAGSFSAMFRSRVIL